MQKIVGDRLRPEAHHDPHGVEDARLTCALRWTCLNANWPVGPGPTVASSALRLRGGARIVLCQKLMAIAKGIRACRPTAEADAASFPCPGAVRSGTLFHMFLHDGAPSVRPNLHKDRMNIYKQAVCRHARHRHRDCGAGGLRKSIQRYFSEFRGRPHGNLDLAGQVQPDHGTLLRTGQLQKGALT